MGRKCLNDTAGLRAQGLRGGDTPSPDAGEAWLGRRAVPGRATVVVGREGYEVRSRPEPSAGSESLRGATLVCGEKF